MALQAELLPTPGFEASGRVLFKAEFTSENNRQDKTGNSKNDQNVRAPPGQPALPTKMGVKESLSVLFRVLLVDVTVCFTERKLYIRQI